MIYRLAALILAMSPLPASAQDSFAQQRAEWNRPVAPFRIAGNVYYVGVAGVSAYLVTDREGHVLIDGGMEESAPLIAGNIRRLGFRVEDVRYLLNNHAHWDHSGGLAELKRLSGAALVASAADKPDLESGRISYRDDVPATRPVVVDRTVADGERIRLGGSVLTAHLTPGHTRGCTSWSMTVREAGRPLDLLLACSLSTAGQQLIGDARYPTAAADFGSTFAKLRRMRADIYLSFHPSAFDLDAKRARLTEGGPNPFVDRGELARRVAVAREAFDTELARQRAEAGRR